MNRIEKLSTWVLYILNILIVVIPVTVISGWVFSETALMKIFISLRHLVNPIITPDGPVNLADVVWTPAGKLAGLAAQTIAYLPLYVGLLYLRRIFARYRNGEIFTTFNAASYRVLGWLAFGDALLAKPLSEGLMTMAVSLSNPPGQRYITIGVGTLNLQGLIFGLIVIAISRVMLEACRLQDEHDLTV